MIKNKTFYAIYLVFAAVLVISFSSCGDDIVNIINNVTTIEVTAKERLDSANAQATRKYGVNTRLVLIMGKNVNADGTTTLSALTAISNPDSIGAWLYVYRVPADTSLRIYTPNPVPTTSDCIELTAFFSTNQLLGMIQDTSAKNILSGALNLIISSNVSITTTPGSLLNSNEALTLASVTNPIIKFNQNYTPDTSSLNGTVFFSTGTNKTTNMVLMPAAGTLHLPDFIQNLTGFPNDLWIVQYKKTNVASQQENLILGTVVQSGQLMGVPIGIQSPVINLSKYVTE
jgi:hypothetical protein